MRITCLKYVAIALITMVGAACAAKHVEVKTEKPIIIAYVGGFHGLVDINTISAEKITHINYAFVNIVDGKAFLSKEETDTVNFRQLNLLKQKNPDLKILISIGGWSWSGKFSDAVLTEESRELFAQSSVDIMSRYHLDGVDIDWEYPALPGDDGNIYRPEDKQNYTLMFAAIRAKLDSLEAKTGEKYLLTTAVGGFKRFIENTEMDKVQQYLDFINIMTYDAQSKDQTIHHTNLFPTDPARPERSADYVVKAYVDAGVPIDKLVMGIAFYGRNFLLKEDAAKGLGDLVEKQREGRGFTFIKDSLETNPAYAKHWDKQAQAPYLFNAQERIFTTYDDEQSVKAKCEYVLSKGMKGVMFWEYGSDPKEYLLDAINEVVK